MGDRAPSPALTESTSAGEFFDSESRLSRANSTNSYASSTGTATPRRRSFVHSEMSRDAYESAVSLPYDGHSASSLQENTQVIPGHPYGQQSSSPVAEPPAQHQQESSDQTVQYQQSHEPAHVAQEAQIDTAREIPRITEQSAALATIGSAAIPAITTSTTENLDEKAALGHMQSEKTHTDIPEKMNKRQSNEGSGSSDTAVNVGDDYSHLPKEQADLLRNQAAVPAQRTVKFIELFRFHTKTEHALNFVGIVFAIAAGVAIPAQMLLFGNLTASFTDFGRAINEGTSVDQLADNLRSEVDKDALILLGIGSAVWLANAVFGTIWTYTGETASRRIRETYLRSVLRQNVAFHDATGSGAIATQIINNTHLVQEAISEKVAITFNLLGTFFAGFVIAFITNWRIALVVSVIVPLIAITGGIMNKFLTKYKKQGLDLVADGGTIGEETFTSIRIVQAFGIQQQLAKLFNNVNDQGLAIGRKSALVQAIGLGVFFSMIYLAYSLAFWFGITMYLANHATSGQIVTAFFSIVIGSFSLVNIAPNATAFTSGISAAGQLFDTIDRKPPIDSLSEKGDKLPEVKGDIELRNINFFYPSRPTVQVLHDFSCSFPRGQHTALVGASGSGKSSILALIERWYEPITGQITLDGHDINSLHLKWMRSQIGLVSQEPVLMNLSVFENIAHGLINTPFENASLEKKRELVYDAARAANAFDFIENLPEQWNTKLGERGSLVSGGQKQRICIARALISNPSVLLLDEATSALDTTSEKLVQDALDKASNGRTTISIAHRLSTIKDAHQIIVVGQGRVIETGDHLSLIAKGGAYAKLVEAQAFTEVADSDEALPSDVQLRELKEKDDRDALRRTPTSKSVASSAYAEKVAVKHHRHNLGYLFKRMGRINSDQKTGYALGGLGATVTGMVFPVFSIIFGVILGVFSETDRGAIRRDGNRGALYFLILAIVATIAVAVQNYYLTLVAEILAVRLRKKTFMAIVQQDVKYFDDADNTSGALTSRISELPQKILGLAGATLGLFIQSSVTLLAGYIVGLAYAPKVAAVGIACAPFTIGAGYARLRFVIMRDEKNKKDHEDSAQLAAESASAIRTISSLTREDDCLRLYSEALEGPQRKALRSAIISNVILGFTVAAGFYTIALIFYYGARQLIDGLGAAPFFIALSATIFGTTQAGAVFQYSPDFSKAASAANNLVQLYDKEIEVDAESPDGEQISNVEGHIVIKDVHFRYPTRPDVPVLRGLNLEVKPGQFIALVGESGCGKSTTTALLERFYDPAKGQVMLDGHDISTLNVRSFRSHLALVSQEPTLFAGTMRFNVLLGAVKPHEEVTEAEVHDACRKANILDFIQSLPEGFDTQVGNKGVQLSGGQKQRIAIARALIRNPRVLILDEATSALDSSSEKVVQAALDEAAKGRSTIAIAHRLSTIQHADVIYVFSRGKVVEQGSHAQLIHQKGHYFELVQKQLVTAPVHQ